MQARVGSVALADLLRERAGTPLPAPDALGLVREPIGPEDAQVLFPSLRGRLFCYDPLTYFWRSPHQHARREFREHPEGTIRIRTNSRGMREDTEVSPVRPSLRVLVTGDSQLEGVCNNHESAPNVLEELLRDRGVPDAEVLNAGRGSFSFHNYLGVLERFADLEPHVFVVVAYGGNDFKGCLLLHRYFTRQPLAEHSPGWYERVKRAVDLSRAAAAQNLIQTAYFRDLPDERALSVSVASDLCRAIARLADSRGVASLFVYLPPASRDWVDKFDERLGAAAEELGFDANDRTLSDELADAWLGALRELGLDVLDLRDDFAKRTGERLYWSSDHHLSIDGHRAVAEALLPVIEAIAADR